MKRVFEIYMISNDGLVCSIQVAKGINFETIEKAEKHLENNIDAWGSDNKYLILPTYKYN